ncbi:GNAT family N-acetyltransferase [uncultured Jatrophihabitans sp.]|uniref:GNAT family N-acetyltransferase n=1 Tax=uncultured Jatrophihabitans sp. TaxID=1610747 RepID=UPI0035C9EBA0
MRIVRAGAAHAPAVADVYLRSRAAAGDAMPAGVHPDDDVRAHVAEVIVPQRETWVATDATGAVVGVLVLADADLHWLFVVPEAQGGGVGSTLLTHAKSRRPDGLALWVFTSNEPARRFYVARGFEVVGGTEGDNEEGAPDLRMAWRPAES